MTVYCRKLMCYLLLMLMVLVMSACGDGSSGGSSGSGGQSGQQPPIPAPSPEIVPEPVSEATIQQIRNLIAEYPDYLTRRLANAQAANLYYEVSHLINASRMWADPEFYGIRDTGEIENYIIRMSERVFTPCEDYDFENDPRKMCRSVAKSNGYYLWRSPLNESETYRKTHAKIEWRVAAAVSFVVKTILENTEEDNGCVFQDTPLATQSLNCRAQNLRRLVYEQIWLKWNDPEFIKTTPVDSYIPDADVSHYLVWIEMIIEMFQGSQYEQPSRFDEIVEFIEIDEDGYFTFKCRTTGVCFWQGYDFAKSNSNDLAHLALPLFYLYEKGVFRDEIIKTLKERTYSNISGYLFPKFDVFINGHCGLVIDQPDQPLSQHCEIYWLNETAINNHHRQLFGLLPYGTHDSDLRDMLLSAADANKDGIIYFDDVMVPSYVVGLYDLVMRREPPLAD